MILAKRSEEQDQVKALEGYWMEVQDIEEEYHEQETS